MDTTTGIVQVAYHQYYLRDQGVVAEIPDEVFTGGNGLISAPPGIAIVHAGTHTGPVRLTVQARPDPPPHTDLEQWEEIEDLGNLVSAGPGSYRLRMHARGRDQADATVPLPEEPIEEHLLITWPAPAAGETVLKQTDQYGALHRGT
jgi:hypothetical protein